MIVVTGATGQLGRAILLALLDRVPAERLGASVRDPAKAADLAARGVRVRHGDFDDPASLADAFDGATQVLIVSSNVAARGGNPVVQHRTAIEAARAAGAERVLYTSHMGASATSAFPPMRDHAATEAMLAASGLAWTALRNGFYASSGLDLLGDPATGVVAAPADGPVSWTAHADLAEATARILAGEAAVDGPTPPLVGGEAIDLAGQAALASGLLGRPVRREILSDEAFAAGLAGRGLPPGAVERVLGLYRAARAGEFRSGDATLARLMGRPPTALVDLMRARFAERGPGA